MSPTRVLEKQRLFLSDVKLLAGLTTPVHDRCVGFSLLLMQCHKTATWKSHRLQMPTSAVSTSFNAAVTYLASQFLALFVHDESDDTAAGSMISETEVCIARISPASSRNSHGRFSTLSAKIFHVVSCNPNLFCTTDVN